MAFIRPSLVLEARLKPQDYTPETEREIKRSYSFIASAIVRVLDETEAADGNVMRFHIRMMKPYWDTSDAAACELWDAVMPRWLGNHALNVTTALNRYNTVGHPAGAGNVDYEWADFEFNTFGTMRVKLNDDNTLSADVPALAEKQRRLSNAKAFGEEQPVLVRMPTKASIAAQIAAYEELKRQAAEARAAAAAAAEAAAAEPEPAPSEEPAEPALDAAVSASDGTVVIDAEAVAAPLPPLEEEEPAPAVQVPAVPPFALDFSVWGLEYADGRVVEFDSATA